MPDINPVPVLKLSANPVSDAKGVKLHVNGACPPAPTFVVTGVKLALTPLVNIFGLVDNGYVDVTANAVGALTVKLNV